MNYSPDLLELSGPARIRAMFFPKVRIGPSEAAKVLGLSYLQFWKRLRKGTLSLVFRKDTGGHPYILIDDLIAYLYPPADPVLSPSCHPEKGKKKPGRPRKSTEGGGK